MRNTLPKDSWERAQVQEMDRLRALNKELATALQYWLPEDMPCPDLRGDVIAEAHNIKWAEARAILGKIPMRDFQSKSSR